MNDEQLIWEAYTNKQQKTQISPIKQELIEFVKGVREYTKMVWSYMSYWEKKTNKIRRNYSEKGEQITPEEERYARIFTDEYLQNSRDIENITADNYEDRVWQTKENMDNNLYYDTLDRLKSLGLSNDHAEELLQKFNNAGDSDLATKYKIDEIMEMDV